MNDKEKGFSLAEVLMAVGVLAVGMLFISSVFLVALHFTTVSSEQTIASIAASEAFAKVQLYGIDPADPNLVNDQQKRFEALTLIDPDEFAYPSTETLADKQYFWSALCRRLATQSRLVQVTIFVSRKIGAGTMYLGPPGNRPVPMPVSVSGTIGNDVLTIDKPSWVNDGYTIVENRTGQIYQVLERNSDRPDTIVLNKPWQSGDSIWVIPPPLTGGRGPCIAVYQKTITIGK